MDLDRVVGFKNMGNTCYFNSALQLLFNCNFFTKLILKNNFDNNFLKGYNQTLKDYFSLTTKTLGPRIIKSFINNEYSQFNNFDQCDSHEVLVCLFDLLEKNINSLDNNLLKDYKNKDLFKKLFYNQISSNIECQESNENFIKHEYDIFLSLPIPNKENLNLEDCFNEYFKKEKLDNDNKYFNEKLNKYVSATKQLDITNSSKYLFIILKRFNNLNQKININIDFNYNYIINNFNYKLIGFIVQIGFANGGHYISVINRNNKWYICNDDKINEVNNITSFLERSYILLFTKF